MFICWFLTGDTLIYTARKTAGSFRGAVGVVAYYVPKIDSTIAFMFSVPFDYTWYENLWNVKLYGQKNQANSRMYDDMKKNPFKADGWKGRRLGPKLKFEGVMSSSSDATLKIHVRTN